jgi:hypothetical protein
MTPNQLKTLEPRARDLHDWYNREMGTKIKWTMEWSRRWVEWLAAGHNGPELKQVIQYLRREFASNRRNVGSLALQNLLNVETFEKDLSLAQMTAKGALDPDKRVTPLPATEAPSVPLAPSVPSRARNHRTAEDGPTPAEYAAYEKQRQQQLADLEALKRNL